MGSIVNLNNAQVAGALGVDVVMIAPGGLGVSFDQLAMNKALLEKHGAQLRVREHVLFYCSKGTHSI